jgi:hypothetical protein
MQGVRYSGPMSCGCRQPSTARRGMTGNSHVLAVLHDSRKRASLVEHSPPVLQWIMMAGASACRPAPPVGASSHRYRAARRARAAAWATTSAPARGCCLASSDAVDRTDGRSPSPRLRRRQHARGQICRHTKLQIRPVNQPRTLSRPAQRARHGAHS